MLKQIRIVPPGVIAVPDREVHTTKDPAKGGPDRVQWLIVGGPHPNEPYRVHFDSSPFLAGPQDILVGRGGSAPHEVTQPNGVYKYSVFDSTGALQDDPDVIIE